MQVEERPAQVRSNNKVIVKHVSFMEAHQEPQEEQKAQHAPISLLEVLEMQDRELDVEFEDFDY